MSDPYVGEIRMFAGNFAPTGWSFCDGTLLPVTQNEALFALLGTVFGGDGRTTFALPDLRGRIPIHRGQGQGLTMRYFGSRFGAEEVTLTDSQLPSHGHNLTASTTAASADSPANTVLAAQADGDLPYTTFDTGLAATINNQTVASAGDNTPHSNIMPSLCVNYIISLYGVYPTPI